MNRSASDRPVWAWLEPPPLTVEYRAGCLVRDLALEIGLPLLVVVAAARDLVSDALLTFEAATEAGLEVAAIAISGWPPSPSRVLLDERQLLADRVPIELVALPADASGSLGALATAADGWPLADWLERPPRARGDEQREARVTLDPYAAWEPRPLGDPRTTRRPEIMAAILEIVAAEGPMRASRAYALYNRAASGSRSTSAADSRS